MATRSDRTDKLSLREQWQQMAVRTQPETANDETRTVDLTWTTGAPVRRVDWWEGKEYDEELSLDDDAVDLSRLNNGAPLLNSHASYQLESMVGVVERAWLEGSGKNREGRATVRFSKHPDVDRIWSDVRDGIIRSVSVGYKPIRADRYERKDKVDLLRIVEWLPMELSLVPIPADDGAKVRSPAAGEVTTLTINNPKQETRAMARTDDAAGAADNDKNVKTDDGKPATETVQPSGGENAPGTKVTVETPAPVVADPGAGERAAPTVTTATPHLDAEAANRQRAEGEAAEAARVTGINATCDALRLDRKRFADPLIATRTTSLAAAREQLIAARAEADDALGVRGVSQVTETRNELQTRLDCMNAALMHRSNPAKFALDDKAREYRGFTLLEMARDALEIAGVKTRGMSKTEIAELALRPGMGGAVQVRGVNGGYNSTSDFANLVGSVGSRSLREGYSQASRTFTAWARRATIPDFRAINRVSIGDTPKLERVLENGEYKRGTLTESAESYKLGTYGKIVGITRQVIVNDDLDAFTRIPERFGVGGANLEADIVYSVLLANAALLQDGTALFHANHANLGSGGAPDVARLGAARAAMRMQVGLGGAGALNIVPKTLIIPASLETAVDQLMTATQPNQTSQTIPAFARSFDIVSEPRLDTGVTVNGVTYAGSLTAWYLAASPGQMDTVEYAYLEGDEGMRIETRNGYEVDGVEIKCSMDFAAKAIDYRGLYKNTGV